MVGDFSVPRKLIYIIKSGKNGRFWAVDFLPVPWWGDRVVPADFLVYRVPSLGEQRMGWKDVGTVAREAKLYLLV